MQASVGMHSQGTEVEALKQLREILLVFKSGPACGLCCLLAFHFQTGCWLLLFFPSLCGCDKYSTKFVVEHADLLVCLQPFTNS
jgi:hypothetical protein